MIGTISLLVPGIYKYLSKYSVYLGTHQAARFIADHTSIYKNQY